jgi:hypothetical protein
VGRGVWDPPNQQSNDFNRFTTYDQLLAGAAQVGDVDHPPNAADVHDYGNPAVVQSGADDWYGYPNLTGATKAVSAANWHVLTVADEPDDAKGYLFWWMAHVPQAAGSAGNLPHDWWRYVLDYDGAVSALPPSSTLYPCEFIEQR